jgi:hypothetical protein
LICHNLVSLEKLVELYHDSVMLDDIGLPPDRGPEALKDGSKAGVGGEVSDCPLEPFFEHLDRH